MRSPLYAARKVRAYFLEMNMPCPGLPFTDEDFYVRAKMALWRRCEQEHTVPVTPNTYEVFLSKHNRPTIRLFSAHQHVASYYWDGYQLRRYDDEETPDALAASP